MRQWQSIMTHIGVILVLVLVTLNGYSQQIQSVLLDKNILTIRSEGIAFLGSGITEEVAKTFAINDAKRNALEQAGTYLESHTEVINFQLVKDDIISYTGSLLKVTILYEKRALINDMFAYKVEVDVMIDTKLLDKRIAEIRADSGLKSQLKEERARIKKLEARIQELQASDSTTNESEVTDLVNILTASDWFKNISLGIHYENIRDFTKAIELDPDHAVAYYNRAIAFKELGKNKEAADDYNEYLRICGDKNDDAEEIRQWIRDMGYTPKY